MTPPSFAAGCDSHLVGARSAPRRANKATTRPYVGSTGPSSPTSPNATARDIASRVARVANTPAPTWVNRGDGGGRTADRSGGTRAGRDESPRGRRLLELEGVRHPLDFLPGHHQRCVFPLRDTVRRLVCRAWELGDGEAAVRLHQVCFGPGSAERASRSDEQRQILSGVGFCFDVLGGVE